MHRPRCGLLQNILHSLILYVIIVMVLVRYQNYLIKFSGSLMTYCFLAVD
jgi:hypothetical protein